jgi:hypothetical protein
LFTSFFGQMFSAKFLSPGMQPFLAVACGGQKSENTVHRIKFFDVCWVKHNREVPKSPVGQKTAIPLH